MDLENFNPEFKIDVNRLIDAATPLEYELIKFLEENEVHTFQRFLLTRTNDEVEQLRDIWNHNAECIKNNDMSIVDRDDLSLIPTIIINHEYDGYMSLDVLTDTISTVTAAVNLIDLVKKGYLTYEMKEDDDDWIFKPTDNFTLEDLFDDGLL